MRKRNAPSRSQGREEKMQATSFFAHCAAIVKAPFRIIGKCLRRFYLRRLLKHYSSCTLHAVDRQASAQLDAALFLLEAEEAGEGEG
jgi:hypothetical protein